MEASEREEEKKEKKREKETLFLEGRNYAGPMSASAHLLAVRDGRRRNWRKK